MTAPTGPGPDPAPAAPRAWALALSVGFFVAALSALGLALLLGGGRGEVDPDEQRRLAPRPAFSWPALAAGEYTAALEAYVADHFPWRDRLLGVHFWLAAHRGPRDERVAFYDVPVGVDDDLDPLADGAGEAALLEGLDALGLMSDEDDRDVLPDLDLDLDLDPGADPADPDAAADADPEGPSATGPARREGGILVVDGRAMQLFSGGPRGARAYARAVNAYEEALRGRARVYSLIVPTAQTFYLPREYARHGHPEPPNIRATYARMAPGVVKVDVLAALRAHVDEYIYFRTDHHWTALGAYYAYVAFCEAAGLRPIPLAAMDRRRKDGFRGSLYRFTRDSALGRDPDYVDYWSPPGEVKVVRYTREGLRVSIGGPLLRERGAGYGVFLGGDFPRIVATTAAGTGRRALLVKNSYGNPFAVFLAPHFDELVIVDYRYFDGSVLDLVRDHQITDVILLNGTITANARFHSARVAWVLDGGERSRKARRARERAGGGAGEGGDGDGDGD